ncbi:MAG: metallophosphoesterase [Owenweeksia sp.]|nr:metallophosphoesterase [Owenweeksia sp.]
MFGEDVWRVLSGSVQKLTGGQGDFLPSRRKFVSQIALGVAAIPFLGIIHGVLRGRYKYRVVRQSLSFKDLPEEFDGLTIAHISDIHSGSFDNADKIRYGIDLINDQQSDLILFTGDLVNNRAEEMEPWINYSAASRHPWVNIPSWAITTMAITSWSSPGQSGQYERLYAIHEELGFHLLRNENLTLGQSQR